MKSKMLTIDNEIKKESAERKIAVLKAMTMGNYHDFKFTYGPIGGSFNIYLSSDYDFDAEECEGSSPEMKLLEAFNFAILCKL